MFKLCKCLNKSFKVSYSDVQLVHVLYIFSIQCYYLCVILFIFSLFSYKTSPQRKLEKFVVMGTFILTQIDLILTSYFHLRIIQLHWSCKHKTTSYCLTTLFNLILLYVIYHCIFIIVCYCLFIIYLMLSCFVFHFIIFFMFINIRKTINTIFTSFSAARVVFILNGLLFSGSAAVTVLTGFTALCGWTAESSRMPQYSFFEFMNTFVKLNGCCVSLCDSVSRSNQTGSHVSPPFKRWKFKNSKNKYRYVTIHPLLLYCCSAHISLDPLTLVSVTTYMQLSRRGSGLLYLACLVSFNVMSFQMYELHSSTSFSFPVMSHQRWMCNNKR